MSVCDGSDSDSWLMECGYITCVGECVYGGCNGHLYNPPPLSLLCPSGSEHKHHQSQHQNLRSLWGEQTRQNQASWLIVDYHETHGICCSLVFHVFSFFADLSILRLRVKGRSFWRSPTLWVWLRQTSMGCAVVIREALSCFCFLYPL